MTATDFQRALVVTLKYEGGFANDPDDPGGATMKGVTAAVYSSWRMRRGLPQRSVRLIEQAELEAIYRQEYWGPAGCNDMAWPLSLVVFDFAVNSGVGQAVRVVQRMVGAYDDGNYGPKTHALLLERSAVWGWEESALKVCTARRVFIARIISQNPKLEKFRAGWQKRIEQLEALVPLPSPGPPV